MDISRKYTFKEFLNNGIEIPKIQRDYAQGREGKETLRRNFLHSIKNAIDEKNPVLTLDFIYGVYKNGNIQPLDGQQRLTTLWLLHWYAAFMMSKNTSRTSELLSGLRYETRTSSADFVKKLCTLNKAKDENIAKIDDYIKNQKWFHKEWNQDPTIQSMLRMLAGTTVKGENNTDILNYDGIAQVFGGCVDVLYKALFEQERIIFYYQPLDKLKRPDDLYIKMNSRGEQLSSIENFKADMISYMKEKEDLQKYVDTESAKSDSYIIKSWDVEWKNRFWNEYTKDNTIFKEEDDYNWVDDCFFIFFKHFFLMECIKNKNGLDQKEQAKNLDYLESNDVDYTSFDYFKSYVDDDSIKLLKLVLDNIADEKKKNKYQKSLCLENNSLSLFGYKFNRLPQIKRNKNKIEFTRFNQEARLKMYAMLKYFEKTHDFSYGDSFKMVMRFITNIIYNPYMLNRKDVLARAKRIDAIFENLDIKEADNTPNTLNKIIALSCAVDNITNELEKINYITKGRNFNQRINAFMKLEAQSLFKGKVDWALSLDENELDWLSKNIGELLNDYNEADEDTESEENETNEEGDLKPLFRAVLSMDEAKEIQIFNIVNYENNPSPARNGIEFNGDHSNTARNKILCDDDKLRKAFVQFLQKLYQDCNDNTKTIADAREQMIKDYLDSIKDDSSVDWRYALIADDAIWKFGKSLKVGMHSDKEIYWYKGTNSNNDDIPLVAYGKYVRKILAEGKKIKSIALDENEEFKLIVSLSDDSTCNWSYNENVKSES